IARQPETDDGVDAAAETAVIQDIDEAAVHGHADRPLTARRRSIDESQSRLGRLQYRHVVAPGIDHDHELAVGSECHATLIAEAVAAAIAAGRECANRR